MKITNPFKSFPLAVFLLLLILVVLTQGEAAFVGVRPVGSATRLRATPTEAWPFVKQSERFPGDVMEESPAVDSAELRSRSLLEHRLKMEAKKKELRSMVGGTGSLLRTKLLLGRRSDPVPPSIAFPAGDPVPVSVSQYISPFLLVPDAFGEWMLPSNNGKDYNGYANPYMYNTRAARYQLANDPASSVAVIQSELDKAAALELFNHAPYGNRHALPSYTREEGVYYMPNKDEQLMRKYREERNFIDNPRGSNLKGYAGWRG